MNKDHLKKIGAFLGVIVLFLVLAYGFVPQVLEGKIVNQSDISGYVGMSHRHTEYNKAHPDEPTQWTDAMFSGMPTATIESSWKGDATQKIYDFLLTGRRPATYLFISLLGGFLLMLSFGTGTLPAIGGALAMTFCAYNLQIIQVGHNTKMQALAFLPWVLAALVFTYRRALRDRRWLPTTLLGALLFAFTVSFQLKANHQQITWYLALMVGLYFLTLLLWILVKKERRPLLGRFAAASGLLLVLGLLGAATTANKMLPVYDYTQYTMRGGSELSGADGKPASEGRKGLDLEYATAWSYGWQELPNLMIPDFNGGSSAAEVNPRESATYKLLRDAGYPKDSYKQLPMYWGPQPFTAGPMYMGAISVFLFLLGLFLYRGKEKWWLLAATLVAVFLSLGNHFMGFTRLFYDYAPLYNKFRTVSMALVILQFTLPLLGFLVLDRILRDGCPRRDLWRKGGLAFALTAGFCLLCWLIPSVAGSFQGASEAGQPAAFLDALQKDRRMLLRHDALMSALYILASFVLLLWACAGEGRRRRMVAAGAICLLVLLNMGSVGKRYLNKDHFVAPRSFQGQFAARPADKAILQDKEAGFRVLDLSVNVFNDSHPSYHHRNIGGYSPAKMQRYQDLIDHCLSREIASLQTAVSQAARGGAQSIGELEAAIPALPWLSALNGKYFIVDGEMPPLRNGRAFGPVWWVDEVVPAATPDEEIALSARVDLRRQAVVGADFPALQTAGGGPAGESATAAEPDEIRLVSYAPNCLVYRYRAATPRLAVFSEVWHPDWNATLTDSGERIDLGRADWLLRAAVLPAGEHELTLRYEPRAYALGIRISRASSWLLIALLVLAGGAALFARKKE